MECKKAREHPRAINFMSSFAKVPVSVGIINGHISGYCWWWRVSQSIKGIATIHTIVETS